MANKQGPTKHPHFRIGKNVDGDGAFVEADIASMQPKDADLQRGRVKRRIEALKEQREMMQQLLEVWSDESDQLEVDNLSEDFELNKYEKN